MIPSPPGLDDALEPRRWPGRLATLLALGCLGACASRSDAAHGPGDEVSSRPRQLFNYLVEERSGGPMTELTTAYADSPSACQLTLWRLLHNRELDRESSSDDVPGDAAWRGSQIYRLPLGALSEQVSVAFVDGAPEIRLACKDAAPCIHSCDRARSGTSAYEDTHDCLFEEDISFTPTNHTLSFGAWDRQHAVELRRVLAAEVERCSSGAVRSRGPAPYSRKQQCERERQVLLEAEADARARCASPDAAVSRAGCLELKRSALAYLGRGACTGERAFGRALEIFAFMCRHGSQSGGTASDRDSQRFPGCHHARELVDRISGEGGRQLATIARCGLIHLGERGCRRAMAEALGPPAERLHCGSIVQLLAGKSVAPKSAYTSRSDPEGGRPPAFDQCVRGD